MVFRPPQDKQRSSDKGSTLYDGDSGSGSGTSWGSRVFGEPAKNIANNPPLQKLLEDPNYGLESTVDPDSSSYDAIDEQMEQYGVWKIKENYRDIESQLARNIIDQEFENIVIELLKNQHILDNALRMFPRLKDIIDAYAIVAKSIADDVDSGTISLTDEYMRAFGAGFESIDSVESTQDLINRWSNHRDDDPAPLPVNPWEMRIGACKLVVPPININVNQTFRVGSLSGGALRQQSSPKFNSGHSETMISMTLYFPNHESIWGLGDKTSLDINFDEEDPYVIDQFISSLRGLITQFKYAPFLPVKNQFLNQGFGITGVTLHSMTISTIEGFPFCVAVNLQMLKFNHEVYLPPIDDFNKAINWGRFRQYIGRAAQKQNSIINEGFLVETKKPIDPNIAKEIEEGGGDGDIEQSVIHYESEPIVEFNRDRDWDQGKHFEIYYPTRTPAKVFAPDTADFRQLGENLGVDQERNAWSSFMEFLGFPIDANPESLYDTVKSNRRQVFSPSDRDKLNNYLEQASIIAQQMDDAHLAAFIEQALSGTGLTGEARDRRIAELRALWFNELINSWQSSPFFQKYLENAEFSDGRFTISEWMVPMERMYINWQNVIVEGVSVSLGNNIVRLQVQMQEEPVHQHIGGRDASVNVSLVVFGEEDLIRLRRIFQHVTGLARLEHAHGVLGFLGIKNVVTALAGIKYVLPLTFETESIEGFPRVTRVKMSFVDFDVMQQKREALSSSQQKQLVNAFGKRNPFLRIKQLWGAFNAYPDFPLSVRDPENNIVGHLEPDYYFKAFQMFDDEIINWGMKTGEESTAERAIELAKALAKMPPAVRNGYEYQRERANDPSLTEAERTKARQRVRSIEIEYGGSALGSALPQISYDPESTYDSLLKGDHQIYFNMGTQSPDQKTESVIRVGSNGIDLGYADAETGEFKTNTKEDGQPNGVGLQLRDDVPDKALTEAHIEDLTPAAAYQNPYVDGSDNPMKQFQMMLTDAQYRDISGRMIRAFPTYMLWLIDEGGRFAGVKLFDNFYGLQSVIDFSMHSSEDVLGDTLVLRLSNLYQKLSTPYKTLFEEDSEFSAIDVINRRQNNLMSGTQDRYIVELENIRLKPGVRVHLRGGYGANPNSLQTLFNGTITAVTQGDIVEVIAQSDAIELAPYVNTTNKKGHSGKIDGALNTGLWLSEPRDLMVRLLSMGSSGFKESLAHATQGMIFSENKFGIRHFGNILYEPLNEDEQKRHDKRFEVIKSSVDSLTEAGSAGEVAGAGLNAVGVSGSSTNMIGNVVSTFQSVLDGESVSRVPVVAAMQSMWTNFFRRRDYEIFKRNIYPGNGLGIAQFLGGDLGDGGLSLALGYDSQGAEINAKGTYTKNKYQEVLEDGLIAREVNDSRRAAGDDEEESSDSGSSIADHAVDIVKNTAISVTDPRRIVGAVGLVGDVLSGRYNSPILQALGITGSDDDMEGFDEVSFRAQTYMKSVWDLFKTCAALLPNYVVAVRPFEDRSTVFYGKPHWLYTSGVIPVSTGVPPSDGPKIEGPDEELRKELKKVAESSNAFADLEAQSQMLAFNDPTAISPYDTSGGMVWSAGDDYRNWPLIYPGKGYISIPHRSGGLGLEMHLPTHRGVPKEGDNHKQLDTLPPNRRYPWYMDRADPGDKIRGGRAKINTDPSQGPTVLRGEEAEWSGRPGSFGVLDPEIEQYYINMRWPWSTGNKSEYFGKKVFVYAESTGKACVCAIAEYGPSEDVVARGIVAGASPDTHAVLGISPGDKCWFGFAPDNLPLGPTDGVGGLAQEDLSLSDLSEDSFENPDAPNTQEQEELSSAEQENMEKYSIDKVAIATGSDLDAVKTNLGYAGFSTSEIDNILKNKLLYVYEAGWADKGVPVWVAPASPNSPANETDRVSIIARRLFDRSYNRTFSDPGTYLGQFRDHSGQVSNSAGRTLNQANSIWDEFRKDFFYFGSINAPTPTKKILQEWIDNALQLESGQYVAGPGTDTKITDSVVYEAVAQFARYMWQTPYARAWLVMVTSKTLDRTSIGPLDPDFDDIPIVGGDGQNDSWDFTDSNPVYDAFRFFLTLDRDNFEKRLQDGKYADPKGARGYLLEYLKSNNQMGLTSDDPFTRGFENLKDIYDNTIGRVWQAIAAGLSGLVSLYRISMMQLGQGLSQVRNMQKQANILNKVFNDSIYYAAGAPGSLLRMADNPFTREYGEPVIEIREPFQRVHFLSSFQHILSNGIQENLSDVATVVTATSDGDYPVTVYFDKGAAPERQIETTIDTGIYWDNARGGGFFGFLHPLLHPIETMRAFTKQATGSSDELLSKRIALSHLKENLKDIYQGELIVLGDADIRPHDLVYLADVYSRMYGMFEVEQVVHTFSPETGFITSITPNAIVTVNDPTRWSVLAWMWSRLSIKDVRDTVRTMINARDNDSSALSKREGVTIEELARGLEPTLFGHLQYVQGNTALTRDIASAAQTGLLGSNAAGTILTGGLAVASAIPGLNLLADLAWDGWKWVRDNLYDQHGCYIQYMTKDGQAMDAGLSYNQGVAVGQHHSLTLLPGILGLDVNVVREGDRRITTNLLLEKLGWKPIDVDNLQRDVSWWVAQTNSKILELSGRSPDGMHLTKPVADLIEVAYIRDGDTIVDTNGQAYRLAGVGALETDHKDTVIPETANQSLGILAEAFLTKRLIIDPEEEGYPPVVAVRLAPNAKTYDRLAAVLFHNVPDGTPPEQRGDKLKEIASQWPLVEWDSYLENGKPATINWEVIASGYAQVSLFGNEFDRDRGAFGLG